MRLHTSLTQVEVYAALSNAGMDGVMLEPLSTHGSRTHAHAFEVSLSAIPGKDARGKTRTAKNSGRYGADPSYFKAATFDEWGSFMAQVFRRDPFAKWAGAYNGREDFLRKTDNRYPC